MIIGKDLIMTLGNASQGLAASKSCELGIDTELIEICSPFQGGWKAFLPTINSWNASAEMLVGTLATHKMLLQHQVNKDELECCFFDIGLQEFYRGNCYIKNLRLRGTVGSLAQMSMTIQPTGELEWADEKNIEMNGTTLGTKQLNFPFNISAVSGSSIVAVGITISADTRVTIPNGYVIINDDAANVISMINNLDNVGLISKIILENNTGDYQSVVLKKSSNSYTVTVISNVMNPQPDIITLSKF